MLLEDRVALITGASRGIGRAIATTFAAAGASVVLCARSEELDVVASEITQAGGRATALRGDVRDDAFARALVQHCRKLHGHIDVLVNNAAIIEQARLGMSSAQATLEMFEVNILAVIQLTQYAMRVMDGKRRPSIIHLASIAGTRGLEGVTGYSATKGAVVAFTRASAKELAPQGIRVNALAPGFIDTDMTRSLPPAWYERRVASIGMGAAGTPQDVANAALFLASPLSNYITGQVLGVDGGMIA